MAGNLTTYSNATSDAYPTPAVWEKCPVLELLENPARGNYFYEDFSKQIIDPDDAAATAWKIVAVSVVGPTLAYDNTGGVTRLTTSFGTTDNNHYQLQSPAIPFKISPSMGALWFEARIGLATVGDNISGFFCGLHETTDAVCLADNTAVMNDKDWIGFHILQADGDSLLASYKEEGGTQQVVQNGCVLDSDGTTAFAAATQYKMGFVYNPKGGKESLKFYVNGVQQGGTVSKVQIADTDTFPDSFMGITIAAKIGSTSIQGHLIDWVRCAQVFA